MTCCNSDRCKQGRAQCPTPLACEAPGKRRYSTSQVTQNLLIAAGCFGGLLFLFFCLGYLVQAIYAS